MAVPNYDEGDAIKTGGETLEIESIDGRTVNFANGRSIHRNGLDRKLGYNKWDIVPDGAGDRDVYVRFGDIPDGEQSTDHSSGQAEAGVSVYDCEQDDDGVYHLVGQQLQTAMLMLNRTIYLVSGERVGTGTDGEPLIRDVEIETELKTPKGVGGFIPEDDA